MAGSCNLMRCCVTLLAEIASAQVLYEMQKCNCLVSYVKVTSAATHCGTQKIPLKAWQWRQPAMHACLHDLDTPHVQPAAVQPKVSAMTCYPATVQSTATP